MIALFDFFRYKSKRLEPLEQLQKEQNYVGLSLRS